MQLEEMLLAMQAFGRPSIGFYSRGWHASVDMHVNQTGAKFEVASYFGHATPTAAALECIERMCAILQKRGADITRLELAR